MSQTFTLIVNDVSDSAYVYALLELPASPSPYKEVRRRRVRNHHLPIDATGSRVAVSSPLLGNKIYHRACVGTDIDDQIGRFRPLVPQFTQACGGESTRSNLSLLCRGDLPPRARIDGGHGTLVEVL